MKTRKIYNLRQLSLSLVFLCMTLTGLLLPVSAYSNSAPITQTSTTATTLVNNKTPGTNQSALQNIPPVQIKTTQKKVLIDDSRGLSAFFILGIAINIVMVITFAWWFSREWRKSKK